MLSRHCTVTIEGDITVVKFDSQPTPAEGRVILTQLAQQYPYQLRLWDMRNIVMNMSNNEIRGMATHGQNTFPLPNRAAFVAGDDLTYGELRVLEVFREEQPQHSLTRVFRDIDEARNWLLEQKHVLDNMQSGSSASAS